MSADPSMGVNTAMLSSMQNAGASAMNGASQLKILHFMAALEHGAGERNFNLQNIAALNGSKQIVPGAGMVALLPTLNNQGILAKLLAEILGRNIGHEEFAGLIGGIEDHASDVTASADIAHAAVEEMDLGHIKASAASSIQQNAAASVIDI